MCTGRLIAILRIRAAFKLTAAGTFMMTCFAGAQAETLSEAAQLALTNPEIQAAASNRQAIDEELRQARGLYYPQLDIEVQSGQEWSDNPITRARTSGDDTWLWRNRASIILQQRLFDGFATDSEVERQISRVDAATKRVSERSTLVGLDTVQAYLDVLRTQTLVAHAQENVRDHQGLLENIRQRVEGGRSGVSDLRQAEARLSDAKATLEDIERRMKDARANYERVVGNPPISLTLPNAPESLPSSVEEAITQASQTNPTILIAKADMNTGKAEREAARSVFYPHINLELAASRGRNLDGQFGDNDDFTALAVMRWNLFRGGIDGAAVREATHRIYEAQARLDSAQRNATEQMRLAWSAMEQAKRQAAFLRERVVATENVKSTYQQQFEIGQRDFLDLIDSQTELFSSRVSLTTAEFTTLLGAYRVKAVEGRLLETLGVQQTDQ